jgi:hypothetical protein
MGGCGISKSSIIQGGATVTQGEKVKNYENRNNYIFIYSANSI